MHMLSARKRLSIVACLDASSTAAKTSLRVPRLATCLACCRKDRTHFVLQVTLACHGIHTLLHKSSWFGWEQRPKHSHAVDGGTHLDLTDKLSVSMQELLANGSPTAQLAFFEDVGPPEAACMCFALALPSTNAATSPTVSALAEALLADSRFVGAPQWPPEASMNTGTQSPHLLACLAVTF